MANQNVQLRGSYAVAGMTVTVQSVDYVVPDNLIIAVPDSVTEQQLIDDLGPIYSTSPATPDPVAVAKTFVAVDLNVGTKQALITVPAGKTFVPSRIVLRAASESLDTASLGFGFDADASDVVASATHVALTGSTLSVALLPIVGAKAGAAGAVFGLKATITQTATVTVDVFGYYV